jgi:hypothetical protein
MVSNRSSENKIKYEITTCETENMRNRIRRRTLLIEGWKKEHEAQNRSPGGTINSIDDLLHLESEQACQENSPIWDSGAEKKSKQSYSLLSTMPG